MFIIKRRDRMSTKKILKKRERLVNELSGISDQINVLSKKFLKATNLYLEILDDYEKELNKK
jgi:hypothetical protein